MLRQLIGEGIVFVVPTASEEIVVRVDPCQFEQVLMNLAINGSDAMPDGGNFTIETGSVIFDAKSKNRPEKLPPGEYATLAVYDTGAGISRETIDHMFEPFFTTNEMGKGTGLGLALCHGIIKQSNGHIEVESELGQGTRFNIDLPMARDEASVGKAANESGPRPTGSETVLVVEDEPLVLTTAVRVTEQHKNDPIDLLLTDSAESTSSRRQSDDRESAHQNPGFPGV